VPPELARLAGAGGSFARNTSKALALALIHGVVGVIGTGQMAHDQRRLEGSKQVGRGGQLIELVLGHAEPVHAGVDVEAAAMRRHGPGSRRPSRAPPAGSRHGAQIEARVVRLGAGQ
jgi:hypothetical protein